MAPVELGRLACRCGRASQRIGHERLASQGFSPRPFPPSTLRGGADCSAGALGTAMPIPLVWIAALKGSVHGWSNRLGRPPPMPGR